VAAGDAPVTSYDGADAAAILLRDRESGEVTRLARNQFGTWFKIYQPNKWAAKQAEAKARAAAAMVAAP